MDQVRRINMAKTKLSIFVVAASVDTSRKVDEYGVLSSAISLEDSSITRNSNFRWFELVLKSA